MRLNATIFNLAALTALAVLSAVACNKQSFEQPPVVQALGQKVTYNNQADVLFVIDTKESMSAVQKGLADQIPAFVDSLNKTGLDYQIAVSTMDMSGGGEQGKFIGSPAIVNAMTPKLATVLQNRIYIGEYDWKPMTRGLEAVKNGLTGLNSSSGPNAGFMRPNALLVLIFLSNRDDRSVPVSGGYSAFFDQIRPPLPYGDRSWIAQFMGVLPDDPNCKTSAWGYAEPGVNFIDFVKASGGSYESICDGDMRRALTNVRARVLEKMTAFPLGAKAAPESIKVTINGRPVANDPVNGWTFDSTNNTLHLHGSAIPDVTDDVRVDFQKEGLS